MTEGLESDFLVKVRAQVMTRDAATEGWLPLAGGGLANVSIRKRNRLSPGSREHEYIIYGQRISDQSVILSCVINRDLKYFKVMPTFHHWRAGKQRNGLTFQTAADARAFDKGIVKAYNELIDDLAQSNPLDTWHPFSKCDSTGEDDVFMALDLPLETDSGQMLQIQQLSSPDGSEKSHKSISGSINGIDESSNNDTSSEKEKFIGIQYISSEKPLPILFPLNQKKNQPTIAPSENYSYVTLTSVNDCNYPVADQSVVAQVLSVRHDSINNLKKYNPVEDTTTESSTTTAVKNSSVSDGIDMVKNQLRCRYCHELYINEWNRNGACEFAPDYFKSSCELVSGLGCARCMLYHCMSDSEGDTLSNPCECRNEPGCTKRWIGLTLLSLLVPCLWCYLPLRACHLIGISCGVCGGKHKPQV